MVFRQIRRKWTLEIGLAMYFICFSMSWNGITPGLGFGASEERKVVPYQRQSPVRTAPRQKRQSSAGAKPGQTQRSSRAAPESRTSEDKVSAETGAPQQRRSKNRAEPGQYQSSTREAPDHRKRSDRAVTQ